MLSAFALFTDALRLANWRSGEQLFTWDTRSPNDQRVVASDGTALSPSDQLEAITRASAVFVAAGFSPEQGFTLDVFRWLRNANRTGAILGGWDTGALVLAEAGLMGGYKMALHWQAMPAVQDIYANTTLCYDRIATKGNRFTGPGGLSTFDLAVELIRKCAGQSVAEMVEQSANRHIRPDQKDEQRLRERGGGKLRRAVAFMEQHIDEPMSIPQLSRRLGMSQRSLNRMFIQQFGRAPAQYYLSLRLHFGANLLRQSRMTVLDIAILAGFTSASRFSQAFKSHFGESPTEVRARASWMRVDGENGLERKLLKTGDDIRHRF